MAIEVVDIPVHGVNGPRRVPKQQLGKDDFLLLLTKQLQYQDPLQPTDNLQFVSQMANFSTLEQITNMNRTLEKFINNLSSSYKAEAMSYLGMKVTANSKNNNEQVKGIVTAIKFDNGKALLRVGNTEVSLDDVVSVEAP